MIFPYVRHLVDRSPAVPSGEVARPEIPLLISGPNGTIEVSALLDTGADHVFLPAALAQLLGIEIDETIADSARGAGGHEISIWPGEVELAISGNGESFRWRAQVGFVQSDDDLAAAYLGHAGFLEHYVAKFDYREQTVELLPYADFLRETAS